MRLHRLFWSGLAVMVVLSASVPCTAAALYGVERPDAGLAMAVTETVGRRTDNENVLAEFLGAPESGRHSAWSAVAADMIGSAPEPGREPSPRLIILEAPALPEAPPRLATLVYPEVTGLAGCGSDERSVPFKNACLMGLAPGGFGRAMLGLPDGAMGNWVLGSESAISYIRPHVNVQMMLAMDLPIGGAGDFEGPGLGTQTRLSVDHRTRVSSDDLGSASDRFGRRPAEADADPEPQIALAAGLDLGLLPTFLAQMGMNVSVVASVGQETGNVQLAMVGTAELPVDWTPIERPVYHPRALAIMPWIHTSSPYGFESGGIADEEFFGDGGNGGGGGGGGGGGRLIPIVPVVPEPMTAILVAAGAAALLARRRR